MNSWAPLDYLEWSLSSVVAKHWNLEKVKAKKVFVARETCYFDQGIFTFDSNVYYLTRGFIGLTRVFDFPTCYFNSSTRAFSFITRAFEFVTCRFELVTHIFEFVIRSLELLTCRFELVNLNS